MNEIIDLRNRFISHQVYAIYAACMYMPTWEKFCEQATILINNNLVSLLGYIHNNHIIGILVIQKTTPESAEIIGIAVNSLYRHKGIGGQLIDYAFHGLKLKSLFAETDDEAVLFYRHCGFEIEEIIKVYDHKEYRRYKCTLEKL